MSDGSSNPPLPGKGIEASAPAPPTLTPIFNEASRGDKPADPPIKLNHDLNLSFGPDGTIAKSGIEEDKRKQALAEHAQNIADQHEKYGPSTRETGRLRDDFDHARNS